MQFGQRYILPFLIALIILIGLALFFLRQQAFQILSNSAGLYDSDLIISAPPSARDAIDTTIFNNAKFIMLKSNVYQFDFDSICRNANSQGQGALSNSSVVCLLGNKLPFAAPELTDNSPRN